MPAPKIDGLWINDLLLQWDNDNDAYGFYTSPGSTMPPFIVENIKGLEPAEWTNIFSDPVNGVQSLQNRSYSNITLEVTLRINSYVITAEEARSIIYKLISQESQINSTTADQVLVRLIDSSLGVNGYFDLRMSVAGIDTDLFAKEQRVTIRLQGITYYWESLESAPTWTDPQPNTTDTIVPYSMPGHYRSDFNLEVEILAGGANKNLYITTETPSDFTGKQTGSWICLRNAPISSGDIIRVSMYPRKELYLTRATAPTFVNLLPYAQISDREGRWPQVNVGTNQKLYVLLSTASIVNLGTPLLTSSSRRVRLFTARPRYAGF